MSIGMRRTEVIRMCLDDLLKGDPHPIMGLVDYLIEDCGCNLFRLLKIVERQFKIPVEDSLKTLKLLV